MSDTTYIFQFADERCDVLVFEFDEGAVGLALANQLVLGATHIGTQLNIKQSNDLNIHVNPSKFENVNERLL
jgi:hypothetical protein